MENDIFISCHPDDLLVAGQIQTALVAVGIRCFIPNRVALDSTVSEAVHQALDASRVFLLVHSSAANDYDPVTREARRAIGRNLRVVLFRLQDVALSEHLVDLLGQPSGVEAFSPPMEQHISYLVEAVQLLLAAISDRKSGSRAAAVTSDVPGLAPTKVPLGDEPPALHETLPTANTAPDAQRHTPQALSSFTDGLNQLRKSQSIDPPTRLGIIGHIDHYEILRKIGEGGMGVVLLATDTKTGQQVAVKTVKPEYVGNPRAQHRFATEAKHMQRMNHPHVLRVMDVCERPNGTYYVMPFIAAGSLAEKITLGTPLEPRLVLKIGRQIADALRYAHDEAGVIHRDIKPENVLVDASENAYLSDFGLVRTVFNDTLPDNHQISWTVGTRPYMAPEIVAGKAGDTRADVYSFGAMLYEMSTGRPPYLGDSAEEVMTKIKLGPPPKVLELNPHCPPELATVIEAAMGRELRDRYAHMADLLADLERADHGIKPVGAHDAPVPVPSVSTDPQIRPVSRGREGSRKSKLKWVAALGIMVMLGILLALVWPPPPVDPKEVFDAITSSDVSALQSLIDKKSFANVSSPTEGSPIRYAISSGKKKHALLLLGTIKDVSQFAIVDGNGDTLMDLSAVCNTDNVIRKLHERGAKVDTQHVGNLQTPLYLAVFHRQPDAVRALLESGANPDLRTGRNVSPRELAMQQPGDDIGRQLTAALNAPVKKAAERAPTGSGVASGRPIVDSDRVHRAIQQNNLLELTNLIRDFDFGDLSNPFIRDAIKMGREDQALTLLPLVNVGELEGVDQSGDTIMELAAAYNLDKVIKGLHDRGAKMDVPRHDNGQTPLYVAVFHRNVKAAQALAASGANPDFKQGKNKSPRELALDQPVEVRSALTAALNANRSP